MSFDKLAGIYVYCMNYHGGQWSRLYRLMSRISSRGLKLTDNAISSIESDNNKNSYWFEARQIYLTLEQRGAQ